MEFRFNSLSNDPYTILAPHKLATPRLLLFRNRLESNIQKMANLLQEMAPGYDFNSLCPHVKTHKSSWVTKKLMTAGVSFFKSTPNEVEMLLKTGVKELFVSYPLLARQANQIAKLASEYKNTRIFVQVSNAAHVDYLLTASRHYDVKWHYFIDLDVGMGRTGIQPKKAVDLYNSMPQSENLQFAGIHGYDGHNHSPGIKERKEEAERSMSIVVDTLRNLEKVCFSVPRVVVGGTPGFLYDLQYLAKEKLDTNILLSPGTWVYFDTKSQALMPDTFDVAACVLAQVIDKTGENRATLNLGHKRLAVDQGPVDTFSVKGMKAISWSEEHTVVSLPRESRIDIGDYVLIAPKHVCSTVNLWETFTVIGSNGRIEKNDVPVDARNR